MNRKGVSILLTLALVVSFFAALPAPRALAACANNASTQFRSASNGNWGSTSTCECSDDGTNWQAATVTPTSSHGTIAVRNGHTVTVAAGVTVDQVTVDAGGQVTVNSGSTFTTADGTGTDLTVNGTFVHSGTVPNPMSGQGALGSGEIGRAHV